MAEQPIVEARSLVKDYGDRRALDNVSIAVPAARFLSVMGPSGSGKSTLLHLLGGLDVPTSGEVVLDGRALSSLSDDELTLVRRHRVGFVFQSYNLVPVLSIEENIALPAVVAGVSEADYRPRLETLLSMVGLKEHRGHLPSDVSGGQQQRAALARAVMLEPAVVLADEPTGNLDRRTGREVLSLLRDARDEFRQTVVLVTHDPVAAAMGDEVVALRDGAISGHLPFGRRSDGERRAQQVLAWLQEQEADADPDGKRPRRKRPLRARA